MMPWSDEQQRLLRAMGYVLYAQAPAAASLPLPMAATGAAESAGAAMLDVSRLLQALRKAASGHDVSAVITDVADVATLRGNAGAKRALWPKLRALRRAGSTSGAAGRMPEAPDAT